MAASKPRKTLKATKKPVVAKATKTKPKASVRAAKHTPAKASSKRSKSFMQLHSRFVTAALAAVVLVVGLTFYWMSNRMATYEGIDDGDDTSESINCAPAGNEVTDVPLGCQEELESTAPANCGGDADAVCGQEATLGDSTNNAPLAWPFKKVDWPDRKNPIANCDLLYSKDDNKTVSNGIEIGAKNGTTFYSASSGTVTYLNGDNMLIKSSLGGKTVYISYSYFQKGSIKVKKGDTVKKTDELGKVGSGGDRAEYNYSLLLAIQKTATFLPNDHVKLDTKAGKERVANLMHPMNYLPLDGRDVSNCRNFRPYHLPESDYGQTSSTGADGISEPKHDYTRVTYRGKHFNRYDVVLLKRAESYVRSAGLSAPSYVQGSYNTSVSASAKTHAGGGAVDISIRAYSSSSQLKILKAYRKAGFAAWIRTPADGFTTHLHAIAIGDASAHSQAKAQVRDYFNHRNGLASHRADRYASSVGYPYPDWAKKFK